MMIEHILNATIERLWQHNINTYTRCTEHEYLNSLMLARDMDPPVYLTYFDHCQNSHNITHFPTSGYPLRIDSLRLSNCSYTSIRTISMIAKPRLKSA